jgi:hypothetical protein
MNDQLFEQVVNSDPVIKFYLREGSLSMLESFSFGSKIDLRIWAFKEALKRYLDIKYKS